MEQFLLPTAGGLLIGLASVILLSTLGRIAGVSGIVWGVIAGPDRNWRGLFLIGLVAGGAIAHTLSGAPIPEAPAAPWWLIALAGLLVGMGTRMGSGCTSGHGVCGIGRLSLRSITATAAFMAAGIFTVFVVRHILGVAL